MDRIEGGCDDSHWGTGIEMANGSSEVVACIQAQSCRYKIG